MLRGAGQNFSSHDVWYTRQSGENLIAARFGVCRIRANVPRGTLHWISGARGSEQRERTPVMSKLKKFPPRLGRGLSSLISMSDEVADDAQRADLSHSPGQTEQASAPAVPLM